MQNQNRFDETTPKREEESNDPNDDLYGDEQENEDNEKIVNKISIIWKRYLLITPKNKKLKYFHLLVALVLYFDFYLTGFILANYKFQNKLPGYDPEFLGYKEKYQFIGLIQAIDIFLNFLKIPVIEGIEIDVPSQVAILYAKSSFITDIIAVLPWAEIDPHYIFFRYLKLMKFNIY